MLLNTVQHNRQQVVIKVPYFLSYCITHAGDMLILSQSVGKSVDYTSNCIIKSTNHPFYACELYASVAHWGHACGIPQQENSLYQNSRYKKGTYRKQSTKIFHSKIFILNLVVSDLLPIHILQFILELLPINRFFFQFFNNNQIIDNNSAQHDTGRSFCVSIVKYDLF